jgi:hypothetical protein
MTDRTLDDHFRDWEGEVFGYGYGTGEPHVLAALKEFLQRCNHEPGGHSYWHEPLEIALGPQVAWLMINALCHANIIDYGTSPRGGWLSPQGQALQAYVADRSVEQLYDIVTASDDEGAPLIGCHREHCNCGAKGYSPTKICHNPFWTERGQK